MANQITRLNEKYIYYFCLFMSFPSVLIFKINISFLFFILFFIGLNIQKKFIISYNIQKILFFLLGGILFSYLFMPLNDEESKQKAFAVLPNYIYWIILVNVIIIKRDLFLTTSIFKAITFGVVLSVFFFATWDYIFKFLPFFNVSSENTFSFLMICFLPISLFYIKNKYGIYKSILFFGLVLFFLAQSGRRAGTTLVLIEGVLTYLLTNISFKSITIMLFAFTFVYILVYNPFTTKILTENSPRLAEMFYENEDLDETDRSFLTRKAMVEKGIIILEKYPFTGIGFNNFGSYEVSFLGNFEGSQLIIDKEGLNSKSAHNSYISLMAEGGLFVFIPFCLILLYILTFFITNFNSIPIDIKPLFFGFIGMIIHFYFISAILNVFAWFFLGLILASIIMIKFNPKGKTKFLVFKNIE